MAVLNASAVKPLGSFDFFPLLAWHQEDCIAQLAERHADNVEVYGSSPYVITFFVFFFVMF